MEQWNKDPHWTYKKIVVGTLVIIIENIDMSKWTKIGAMTIVTFIQFDDN